MQVFNLHWTNIICLVPDDYSIEETASFLACITECVLLEEPLMLEHLVDDDILEGMEMDLGTPLLPQDD